MEAGMALEVKDLVVCRKGKAILDRVTFQARPNTLTAIIGPNGAGKTTLMRALTGERPAGGQVLVNGQDIYAGPERWLQKIGYVPVDNILHEHLTVWQALVYIGRLRLPDLTRSQIEARVDHLLTQFGFPPDDSRRQKMIKVLSSGERKRANVCSELLLDPPLLMLDEPTSNLDPNAEVHLMELLAEYAHRHGKTILVITHTLNTIDLCDEVVFIENSRLRAQGQPLEVLARLEADLSLTPDPAGKSYSRWAQVFEHTQTQPERRRDYRPERRPAARRPRSAAPVAAQVSWISQFQTLFGRYIQVRLGDKWGLIGTLLAGFAGLLFFTLPGKAFVKPFDFAERALALNQARQSVYVVSLVVTLLGMITSYTEISREFRIYTHERSKGLSPAAYFCSKWAWLTLAVGVLAPMILMGFIVLVYQQPFTGFLEPHLGETPGWWEKLVRFQLPGLLTGRASGLILITLILSCITSVTLGLLISCAAGDGGKGYLYLSFTVVFMVLFSGLIRNPRLETLIERLSAFSAGKWAYDGLASSLSLYCWVDSWRFDEFNSWGHLVSIWLALGVFTLASICLAVGLLHLRDPWYGRWTNLALLVTRNGHASLLILAVAAGLLSYNLFLSGLSYQYHTLNYWSRAEYGGSNAYRYAHVESISRPGLLEHWTGTVSQSWCGEE